MKGLYKIWQEITAFLQGLPVFLPVFLGNSADLSNGMITCFPVHLSCFMLACGNLQEGYIPRERYVSYKRIHHLLLEGMACMAFLCISLQGGAFILRRESCKGEFIKFISKSASTKGANFSSKSEMMRQPLSESNTDQYCQYFTFVFGFWQWMNEWMKWNEMNEMNEMTWHDMKWNELKWNEMEWMNE